MSDIIVPAAKERKLMMYLSLRSAAVQVMRSPLLSLPVISSQVTQRQGFRQVEEHKVCVITGASR